MKLFIRVLAASFVLFCVGASHAVGDQGFGGGISLEDISWLPVGGFGRPLEYFVPSAATVPEPVGISLGDIEQLPAGSLGRPTIFVPPVETVEADVGSAFPPGLQPGGRPAPLGLPKKASRDISRLPVGTLGRPLERFAPPVGTAPRRKEGAWYFIQRPDYPTLLGSVGFGSRLEGVSYQRPGRFGIYTPSPKQAVEQAPPAVPLGGYGQQRGQVPRLRIRVPRQRIRVLRGRYWRY